MINLFQTLIDILKEIQNTNLTAVFISLITIIGLISNNEFLKVIFIYQKIIVKIFIIILYIIT